MGGSTAPPEFIEFNVLQEFWQRLGWTEDDIDRKPRRQIEDFIDFIRIIHDNEKQEIERSKRR